MRRSHARRKKSQHRFETRDERKANARAKEEAAAREKRERYASCPNHGAHFSGGAVVQYEATDTALEYPLFIKTITGDKRLIGYTLRCPHCRGTWSYSYRETLVHP